MYHLDVLRVCTAHQASALGFVVFACVRFEGAGTKKQHD